MTELITFLGAFLLRAGQQWFQNAQEQRKFELEILAQRQKLESDLIKGARETSVNSKIFAWSQAIIALIVVCAVFVGPVIAAFKGIPVAFAYTEIKEAWSFLFFGGGGGEDMMFKMLPGLVITPIQTHMAAAIAGLYFGKLPGSRRS